MVGSPHRTIRTSVPRRRKSRSASRVSPVARSNRAISGWRLASEAANSPKSFDHAASSKAGDLPNTEHSPSDTKGLWLKSATRVVLPLSIVQFIQHRPGLRFQRSFKRSLFAHVLQVEAELAANVQHRPVLRQNGAMDTPDFLVP